MTPGCRVQVNSPASRFHEMRGELMTQEGEFWLVQFPLGDAQCPVKLKLPFRDHELTLLNNPDPKP